MSQTPTTIEVRREKARAKMAAWRAANPERARANQIGWRLRNREYSRLKAKAWRDADPERARASTKANYIKYREKHIAKALAWQRNNPDKVRIRAHNYRARKKKSSGKLSIDLRSVLHSEQGGRCVYCFQELTGKRASLDHFVPLALGGKNVDENMVLACHSCNCSKRHTHPMEFLRRIGLMSFS